MSGQLLIKINRRHEHSSLRHSELGAAYHWWEDFSHYEKYICFLVLPLKLIHVLYSFSL